MPIWEDISQAFIADNGVQVSAQLPVIDWYELVAGICMLHLAGPNLTNRPKTLWELLKMQSFQLHRPLTNHRLPEKCPPELFSSSLSHPSYRRISSSKVCLFRGNKIRSLNGKTFGHRR